MIYLKKTLLAGWLFLIAFTPSCYEDPERNNSNDPQNWETVYPANGYYGENILNEDSFIAELNNSYSLRADIRGYYSVRVTVPDNLTLSISPFSIDWRVITNDDWDYILFLAEGPGVFDCDFRVAGPAAFTGKIGVYENDDMTPVRQIDISLE
ncbi:MAG: hypothetical protein MUC95_09570 [Spirochaetes bacterium]|jgi:hypothetical protein|nr:hypothetical protein [Spirochaetota bacterium]